MRHFLTTADWSRDELQAILDQARVFKEHPVGEALKDRSVALVFFNPSLRTRSSFDLGVHQLGGHAIILEPGQGAWPIEFDDGAIMDAAPEEHIKEVARVLSRYCDLIAVRAFPKFVDWTSDRRDQVITQFARYADVPVINMETITHPCQELALMMTLQDALGEKTDGKKFVLTWTYHPKGLNTAVVNSALLIAAKFGFDVTLLCPTPEYVLDRRYMDYGQEFAKACGRRVTVSHDIESAYEGADVVYAKSWGALPYFGRWEEEKPLRDAHKHFIVDSQKMDLTNQAYFSHCLPLRRNVKATDAVVDSPESLVIEEAENRLHVQKALMCDLLQVERA